MTQHEPRPTPGPWSALFGSKKPEQVPDEQLWSWVDRDAPELALHLESHPEDRTRVDDLRRAIRAVSGSDRDDRAPDRIGPYPIEGKLGSGGMGVVFEAVQVRTNRRVAIKVIRGAWLDDERTRRLFFREAEVLGRLQHTGIAAIHDAGETKEGAPYFVMELIDGKPLDEWAAGQDIDTKLDVAMQIADAVDHAHGKNVIHRDLKPSNVIVTSNNEAKVLDFGLARIVDPSSNASLTAAMSGNVIGTVRYMSPEQARGLASKVTPASDVYSMGVLIYELVTGRLPHDFEGADLFECARRVAEDKIQPPSRWNPKVSVDLDRVLRRALAKEPTSRYASAQELRADLARVRAGESVDDRLKPVDLGELIGRWGVDLGCAVGKLGVSVTSRAAEVLQTREARELKKKALLAQEALKAKVIRVDLNPVMDAAAAAGKGARAAAETSRRSLGMAQRGARRASRRLRPWLWRFGIVAAVGSAIGLAIAIEVEYNGQWDNFFDVLFTRLRSIFRELKREIF